MSCRICDKGLEAVVSRTGASLDITCQSCGTTHHLAGLVEFRNKP